MVRSVKLYNNFQINKQHKNSIILIGNFDGVHLGHQKLFTLAKERGIISSIPDIDLIFPH